MVACSRCGALLPEVDARCARCGSLSGLPKDPLLGKLFGPYTLVRRLGAGGLGVVYEAQGQRRAAVKLLSHGITEPEFIERFRREALVARRLHHPSAIKLFEDGQAPDGTLWLAMELLQGEPLESVLARSGPLSVAFVVSLLDSLCGLLMEAHPKGILHRDISTANIMLVEEGGRRRAEGKETPTPADGSSASAQSQASALFPVLLDFGFASLQGEESLTQTGTVSGTAQYMSPEQWEGLKNTDPRSDLYSLGVVAFECLSGKLPVEAKNPLDWIRKHALSRPLDLKVAMQGRDLPEKLYQTVMRAISKRPEERFQSAGEFKEALS